MKKAIKKLSRKKSKSQATQGRITNDTVALHREEVLRGARKFIYPLQHTKHRLVVISVGVFLVSLITFFGFCTFALYKQKTTSDFMYKVTKVLPFPIARIGSEFVMYEQYLFEVNHYVHYYESQQELDFETDAGKQQLAEYKKRAFDKVINDAYIRGIAKDKNIVVTEADIDSEIARVRSQNRLTGNDQELEAILRDYWNWSMSDFRRSLKTQLLSQKVISNLDTNAHDRANIALAQLKNGKDFAELAREVSDDAVTKENGGEYPFFIDKANRDISPQLTEALFALQPGQFSEVVDVGYGLEIVKNIENKGNEIRAAHIAFSFKDVNEYLNDVKEQRQTRSYVSF